MNHGGDGTNIFRRTRLLSQTASSFFGGDKRVSLSAKSDRNYLVFPYELDQGKSDDMADSHTTMKLKNMYKYDQNLTKWIDKIYIDQAYYYKAKHRPQHEFIIFLVKTTTDDNMQNYIALDRNVNVPGSSGALRLVSNSNRPKALDKFHVSHHRNVGSLIKLCGATESESSCVCVESTGFLPKALTFAELVIVASTISESCPQYQLNDTNCYWFAGLVWDCIRRIFENGISRYEKTSDDRGRFQGKRIARPTNNFEETLQKCKSNLDEFQKERRSKKPRPSPMSWVITTGSMYEGTPSERTSWLDPSDYAEESEKALAGEITESYDWVTPEDVDDSPDRPCEAPSEKPFRADKANLPTILDVGEKHDVSAHPSVPEDTSVLSFPTVHGLTSALPPYKQKDKAWNTRVINHDAYERVRRISHSGALLSRSPSHTSSLGSATSSLTATGSQASFPGDRNMLAIRQRSISTSSGSPMVRPPSAGSRSPTTSGRTPGSAEQPRPSPLGRSRVTSAVGKIPVNDAQKAPPRIARATPTPSAEIPKSPSHTTPEVASPEGTALRAQARLEEEKMQVLLTASRQAETEGDETRAKHLRDLSRDHEEKLARLHKEAATRIFEDMNKDRPEHEIDLDGLYASEAIPLLNKFLRRATNHSQVRILISESAPGEEYSQLLAAIQQSIDSEGYPRRTDPARKGIA